MKTCKKILAGVLVFAMMLSMCAFTVSADDVTEAPAASVLYSKNTFNGMKTGASVNANAKGFADDYGIAKPTFLTKSAGNTAALGGKMEIKEDSTGNKYVSSTWGAVGYNHRQGTEVISANVDLEAYPVMHFSYDMMIPDTDANKTVKRYSAFVAGTTATTGYGSSVLDLRFDITDGVITAKNQEGNTKIYSNSANYTYGEWVTLQGFVWVNEEGKMKYVMYVGDTMLCAGVSTVGGEDATHRFSTNTWEFRNNDPTTILAETCYDNIILEFLPETAKVSDDVIYTMISKIPYVEVLKFSGASLASTTAGTSGKTVFKSTGELTTSIVQGSSTDEHTAEAYELIEDENGNYTNLTSTSYKYLPGNVRGSFSKWVEKGTGDKSTFVYSTDMKVSNFNANVLGRMSIGLDMMSGDLKDADGNVIAKENKEGNALIYFNVGADGKIGFANTVEKNHYRGIPSAPVAGAKRSEKRDVTAGEWFNVKFVLEITHGATQYEIKVYGIFENDVIFEDEYTITYTDYDKDGVSDDIHVGQFDYLIGADDTEHDETVTSFRSMTFTKNNNFDWSEVNTDAWLIRKVEISKLESGNYKVYAKETGVTFDDEVLVIAICNANGYVKEIITSTDIAEDGTFSYEIPAAKVEAGNIIKGFVFDTITSAKPQMPSGKYIVK